MSFMRWQAERGVLHPTDATPPGSPWWRAVNERLLRDGCEAVARSGGLRGEPSSPTIGPWMAFVASPTPRTYYAAHNTSIVAAYVGNHGLAEMESMAERFFLNVVLVRVLYAHALVAAPSLALGPLAALGPVLGDPRLGMAGAFLSLRRVLPDRYPLASEVETYVADEQSLGRILDYGVIAPRLQRLYDWSAIELGHRGLRDLIRDGSPHLRLVLRAAARLDQGAHATGRPRAHACDLTAPVAPPRRARRYASRPAHTVTRSSGRPTFVATSHAAWSSFSVQTSRTAMTVPSRSIVQPACLAAASSADRCSPRSNPSGNVTSNGSDPCGRSRLDTREA